MSLEAWGDEGDDMIDPDTEPVAAALAEIRDDVQRHQSDLRQQLRSVSQGSVWAGERKRNLQSRIDLLTWVVNRIEESVQAHLR